MPEPIKPKVSPNRVAFETVTINHVPVWMIIAAFLIGAAVVAIAIGLLPESTESDTDAG